MKKLVLLIAVFITGIQSITAQTPSQQDNNKPRLTPKQRTEMHIKTMDEKLALSDEQKNEIRTLYTNFHNQHLQDDERKKALRELSNQIMNILTDEQKPKYAEIQKQMLKNYKKTTDKK